MAGSDDKTPFLAVNLNDYYGKMPDHLLLSLANQQKTINAKDAEAVAKGTYQKAAFDAVKPMLIPILDAVPKGSKQKENRDTMENTFRGMLSEAVDSEHAQTGKWPDAARSQQLAAGLLAKGKVARSFWFDRPAVAFQEPTLKDFYVPLPEPKTPERTEAVQAYQRRYGKTPTEAELQAEVTKQVLAGKKPPWVK
jgi:hypothetical protein